MERYKSVLETQSTDCDSLQFKMDALDETKVNMINVLFYVILDSDLNFVFLKFLNDEKGAVQAII